jgi:hypothetical protein
MTIAIAVTALGVVGLILAFTTHNTDAVALLSGSARDRAAGDGIRSRPPHLDPAGRRAIREPLNGAAGWCLKEGPAVPGILGLPVRGKVLGPEAPSIPTLWERSRMGSQARATEEPKLAASSHLRMLTGRFLLPMPLRNIW